MSKKNILGIILIIAIISTSLQCYASTDSLYYIEFLPMAIILPEDYIVLTRDTKKDDLAFKTLGLDYDTTKEFFGNQNIYLVAYPQTVNTLISIVIFEANSFVPDLSKLSDKTIHSMYETAVSEDIEHGASVSDFEIIRNTDGTYIKYYYQKQDMSYFQFTTLYDKHSVQITAQVYNQDNKEQINQIITNIVNNNIFYGDKAYAQNNTYTEPITGTIFHLRKDIEVIDENKDGRSMIAFKSSKDNSTIHFMYEDIINKLSRDALYNIVDNNKTRKDLGVEYLDLNNMASGMNVSVDDIKSFVCNDINYFYYIVPSNISNDSQLSMVFTVVNGYIYNYIFEKPYSLLSLFKKNDITEFETFFKDVSYNIIPAS